MDAKVRVNYLEQAAQVLARGRLEGRPMEPLPPHLRPDGAPDAYALQRALHRRYRDAGLGHLAGYKIGCTTRVMQDYLGIDQPCAGGVLAPTVHHEQAELAHDAFCRAGVECEIAVRLARDLEPREQPWTRDEVAGAVGQVMAAIEVVDDRWRDFTQVDAHSLTADDFFGAGCVLGPPLAFDPALDLAALRGEMAIDGQLAGEGCGADILGHPLEALAWLAGSTASSDGLHAGQVVLLGSIVRTCWLARGQHVRARIDALARAEVRCA